MPKSGAGSEYGREQREEARKKKYGMNIKKYNSDEQPWLLNIGEGASGKPMLWVTAFFSGFWLRVKMRFCLF